MLPFIRSFIFGFLGCLIALSGAAHSPQRLGSIEPGFVEIAKNGFMFDTRPENIFIPDASAQPKETCLLSENRFHLLGIYKTFDEPGFQRHRFAGGYQGWVKSFAIQVKAFPIIRSVSAGSNLQFSFPPGYFGGSFSKISEGDKAVGKTSLLGIRLFFNRNQPRFILLVHQKPASLPVDDVLGTYLGSASTFCGSTCGPSQQSSLSPHAETLTPHGFESQVQKRGLKSAEQNQEPAEYPISAVSPVLTYRHGGKFADSYGLLCILGSYVMAWIFIFRGCCWIDRGLRWRGWCLISGAVLLDILASASGFVSRLPWDWRWFGRL